MGPMPRHPRPRRTALRAISWVVGTVLLTGAALAPAATARPSEPTDPAVDALLAKRLDNPRIGDRVGLLVLDAATGQVVSQHDAEGRYLPASNMKIVTAVTALATMGATTRLTTTVRAGATPTDVILEGGGDPLLTTEHLLRLAKRTARGLAPAVPIVVHVDDDRFPDTRRGPGWTSSYIPYVVAPVEALGRLGDYSTDPSRNAAMVFVQRLRALGVPATLGEDADAGDGTVLAQTRGHTVDQVVSLMLSRSENNVAEVLYRQVAVATGVEASWDGARAATEAVLRSLGVEPAGMALLDGSGLSRKNRVSPRFLVDVLRVARVTNPGPFAAMFEADALPVSGRTGTLATAYGRYVTKQSRCAQGDVHAKTGSLFDTITLAGVAATEDGDERLFAMLVNDRPQRFSALSTRQALDGLTATITGCWD